LQSSFLDRQVTEMGPSAGNFFLVAANSNTTAVWYRLDKRALPMPSGGLGGQARDADLLIRVGRGDPHAVGMQVHVARQCRKLESMKSLLRIRLPKQEEATTRAAADAHQRAVAQPAQSGNSATGNAVGNLLLFEFLRLPIKKK